MKIDLYNADCLEKMKDIPDGSIDAVITDIPYGTTACKWDNIIPFEPMWEQLKRITKKNGAIVLFGSQPFTSALVMSNPKMFKYQWYWKKNIKTGHLNTKTQPMRNTEDVLVFYNKLLTFNPQGILRYGKIKKRGSSQKTNQTPCGLENFQEFTNYPTHDLFFDIEKKPLHPTQKPVALMEYLIKTYTNEGETVLDFTMGSGTTGVACKNLNRSFIGIELDKEYFEIAKNRIN